MGLAVVEQMPSLAQEEQVGRFIDVARKSKIPEGGAFAVEVEGKRFALVNLGGEIYAIARISKSQQLRSRIKRTTVRDAARI